MRKTFAVVLMLAVAVAAIPARLFAAVKAGARQQSGTLNGVAQGANKETLPNYKVQLRDSNTGKLVETQISSQTGSFSFAGLPQGSYVIEVVSAAGKVVGLSPSVVVNAGATVSVTVTASAAGAIAAGTTGGFGLLGLGPLASVAVIGAAVGAAAVVTVKSTQSPSK